jgi:hypothetical protein
MTLSRFLKDYLYIPLGGNRHGKLRRYMNLLLTMVLGGLWHGAGWTFVIWGALHGFFLTWNHAWRSAMDAIGFRGLGGPGRALSTGLTFAAVTVAWVFFRAESIEAAFRLLRGMAGLNGFVLPEAMGTRSGKAGLLFLAGTAAAVWFMPNTQEMLDYRYGKDGGAPGGSAAHPGLGAVRAVGLHSCTYGGVRGGRHLTAVGIPLFQVLT